MGSLAPDQIDEALFERHLTTWGLPDPDLLIRTSGETRISNFLPWQIAYTELYFTRTLWPDFRRAETLLALLDYQKRERTVWASATVRFFLTHTVSSKPSFIRHLHLTPIAPFSNTHYGSPPTIFRLGLYPIAVCGHSILPSLALFLLISATMRRYLHSGNFYHSTSQIVLRCR